MTNNIEYAVGEETKLLASRIDASEKHLSTRHGVGDSGRRRR